MHGAEDAQMMKQADAQRQMRGAMNASALASAPEVQRLDSITHGLSGILEHAQHLESRLSRQVNRVFGSGRPETGAPGLAQTSPDGVLDTIDLQLRLIAATLEAINRQVGTIESL